MAGITDVPFRDLVLHLGADAVVSEMVASQEVVQRRPGARARAELGLGVAGTVVQLAGRDPAWMAEAARVVAGAGARRIDINMGCPARKVVGGLSGSALMREPDRALALVDAAVAAGGVPVSVKMRLGWDDTERNAPDLARRIEAAGAASIAVHGRTRAQFYAGRADWRAVGRVKAAVSVPVLVNGDIVCLASARRALAQSGADGVMIGRGAQGRPWLPGAVAAALAGRPPPAPPDLAATVAAHYEAALGFHGRDRGVRTMRKHLGWYLAAAGATADLRDRILRESEPARVLALVTRAFERPAAIAA